MNSYRKLLLAFFGIVTLSLILVCIFPNLKYNLRDPRYLALKKFIFSEQKAEIVFLGSSQIWTAVDTPFLNSQLRKKSFNLGVNWHGDQIRWILARDILKRKSLEKLVIEIHSFNDVDEHPYFKYMAGGPELRGYSAQQFIRMGQAIAAHQIRDFAYHLSLFTRFLAPFSIKGIYFAFREMTSRDSTEKLANDGYLSQSGGGIMERPWDKMLSQSTEKPTPAIQKLSNFCQSRNVSLYFLFVPQYGEPSPSREWLQSLSHYGTPLVISPNFLYKSENWFNNEHLNQKGARLFSENLLASNLFQGTDDKK